MHLDSLADVPTSVIVNVQHDHPREAGMIAPVAMPHFWMSASSVRFPWSLGLSDAGIGKYTLGLRVPHRQPLERQRVTPLMYVNGI